VNKITSQRENAISQIANSTLQRLSTNEKNIIGRISTYSAYDAKISTDTPMGNTGY